MFCCTKGLIKNNKYNKYFNVNDKDNEDDDNN